jgi:hypothetical protein
MTDLPSPVLDRMQAMIERWQAAGNPQAVFLSCYRMMTANMLTAITRGEFHDPAWVERLLGLFAEYYFAAVQAYEQNPQAAPPVWRLTLERTGEPHVLALQKLILGVNAHINYDLVLTLAELLAPEWEQLSPAGRRQRYADHCHVNAVIWRTIDAVQDQVIEPHMPALDLVDKALGPLDELLVSRLISHWRDTVWESAAHLLETGDPQAQSDLVRQVEADALQRAEAILMKGWPGAIRELL